MQRTPITLQPRLAAQAAAGHTTSMWQVRGVMLWLVALSEAAIRHQSSPPLSFAVLCMHEYVCAVCRASGSRREKKVYGSLVIRSNGHHAQFRIRYREFEPRRVHVYFFFFSNFVSYIMYVTQTPQTTDSARAVQGACYKLRVAKTLYTPAACQQSRKQHHTRAVVCPRCITAVASYLIRSSCFRYRTCDL